MSTTIGTVKGRVAAATLCTWAWLLLGAPSPARAEGFPATGQRTCWSSDGSKVVCAGTGQDGETRAGSAIDLVDNGDGTLTDLNTRLVWEKLSRDGSIHDRDAVSTWDQALAGKIAQLNAVPCFAGHCDWRLPNAKELQSIVDFQRKAPALTKRFSKACRAGCGGVDCGCTPAAVASGATGFWSSTTNVSATTEAWQLVHETGALASAGKNGLGSVRAVRSLVACTKAVATVSTKFTSGGSAVSGITTDVGYPAHLVTVPGSSSEPSVVQRVTNLTGTTGGLFSVGDDDASIGVGLVNLTQSIPSGPFAAIEFDCAPGAPAPTIDQLECEAAISDFLGNTIEGTCSITKLVVQ